jgi:hypothetical protein
LSPQFWYLSVPDCVKGGQVQDHGEVNEQDGAARQGGSILGLCAHYPMEFEITVVLGVLFIISLGKVLRATLIMCLKRKCKRRMNLKRGQRVEGAYEDI